MGETVPPESLVSDRAAAERDYWLSQLNSTAATDGRRSLDAMQDTVGAVAYFSGQGAVAAGVSRCGSVDAMYSQSLTSFAVGEFVLPLIPRRC